ncbi:type 4 pilus major pilin [Photorhabdus heterorhabditis]|uniref:Pilus assembly protein PilX n=1 Tax=Photorhabdus heterorhabditis TaxID=880156 RepID=A0A5B0X8S9_9GAMM|nr:type 4 pilus major pilin [Photorhabdus heterorhabditis]KAA1195736.1 pilus assembly protein PilX [Photorhabdus heterorhabditis]
MQYMMIQKQDRMVRAPERGWAILENGAVALVVIAVITVVLGGIYMLYDRKDAVVETTNLQTIISSTQGLMKGSGGYEFSHADRMTGVLIQLGGVPKSMTVRGDTTVGNATLWNTWGGQVKVGPSSTGGFNNGFTVTYERVPQSACVSLATGMSRGGSASEIAINNTHHADGKVTLESASTECTRNNGHTGTNKLIFTING